MKLWGYTLIEFNRVFIDGTVMFLKNIDELFDGEEEILYTGDPDRQLGSSISPAHQSFLIMKPSLERFEEFKAIIKKGEHGRYGWRESQIGNFLGGQSLSGLLPYVYQKLHKKAFSRQLNRCQYNGLIRSPFRPGTKKCLDGQRSCPDCESTHSRTFLQSIRWLWSTVELSKI